MSSALALGDVVVTYGPIRALDAITVDIPAGETTAVLGANGAGKSSLVKAIAGLVSVAGSVTIDGSPIPADPTRAARAGIGLVPEGRQIFAHLTVGENLRLGGLGAGRRSVADGVERAMAMFPILASRRRQLAGTMSGGEQQMLAIGRALVRRPRVLLLDEPTLGLAPLVAETIYAAVAAIHDDGTTVVIVEQKARRAHEVAAHAILLHRGTLVAAGPTAAVVADQHLDRAYLS